MTGTWNPRLLRHEYIVDGKALGIVRKVHSGYSWSVPGFGQSGTSTALRDAQRAVQWVLAGYTPQGVGAVKCPSCRREVKISAKTRKCLRIPDHTDYRNGKRCRGSRIREGKLAAQESHAK
jgi:hypothetical protein